MATLLEAYKNRIALGERLYKDSHMGAEMSTVKKVALAQCLANTQRFLGEAINSSVGTQAADLGLYKKFCVELTNIAVPNLIGTELVITHPMTSRSGYLTYLQYTATQTKGQTTAGDVFNTPFAIKNVDADYSGARVVETITDTSADVELAWGPVVTGAFTTITVAGKEVEFRTDAAASYTAEELATKATKDVKIIASDGTVTFADLSNGKVPSASLTANCRVAYVYNNEIVPQNDIPRIKVEMKSIPLVAKARRLAIFYSQIAAFEAKTDYGFDLNAGLEQQATGRLMYEIDTEIVNTIDTAAGTEKADLIWSKTVPNAVSKMEHYMGFAEVVEIAKNYIYQATQRFVPNYMICASDILAVLAFSNQWKPANVTDINGPYMAGTYGSLKVYVSPALTAGRYVIGVNGNDEQSSVACYAPYMPIVPSQLLQWEDGGSNQGFATMYDLVVLNPELCVAGKITA